MMEEGQTGQPGHIDDNKIILLSSNVTDPIETGLIISPDDC